ncbi:MAG TPA: RNA methyltransferase [Acidimicrobiales bacterium]|nr:RNA methyltransferase [Acidimicrobiales bacterium]
MAPTPIEVVDPTDPRLFDFVELRDGRSPDGAFIVEGLGPLEQLVSSAYATRAVLVSHAKLPRVAPLLAGIDAPLYVGDMPLVRATVGFNLHRGVVASATRRPELDPVSLIGDARRIAVLENLNDVENLGNLFRSARAFGVDAVLLDPQTADPLYRRCVRVSMGHVLHVPFARFDRWPDPIDELRALGFAVAALTPAGDAIDIDEVKGERIAWLLGAEGPGLTAEAMSRADVRVRIPIDPEVDSLNVGTAAAIAFRY